MCCPQAGRHRPSHLQLEGLEEVVTGSLAAVECLKRMLRLCLICCMTKKSAPWVTLWLASGPTSPSGLAPAARSPSLKRSSCGGCRTCDLDLCSECLLKSKHDPVAHGSKRKPWPIHDFKVVHAAAANEEGRLIPRSFKARLLWNGCSRFVRFECPSDSLLEGGVPSSCCIRMALICLLKPSVWSQKLPSRARISYKRRLVRRDALPCFAKSSLPPLSISPSRLTLSATCTCCCRRGCCLSTRC